MYNIEGLGHLIRRRREEKRLSREKLAELCDISDKCISNIEFGLADPKATTLLPICNELEIDIGDLGEFCVRGEECG